MDLLVALVATYNEKTNCEDVVFNLFDNESTYGFFTGYKAAQQLLHRSEFFQVTAFKQTSVSYLTSSVVE